MVSRNRIAASRLPRRAGFRRAAVACLALLAAAPATPAPAVAVNVVAGNDVAPGGSGARTVVVVSNGWHASLVLARADIPAGRIPEAADFPGARFLEFGWGDAEYYPAASPSLARALRAALTPTPAVLHVAGFDLPPAARYPSAETVALALAPDAVARLVAAIDATFARDGPPGAPAPPSPGLHPDSRFYPATGTFHLGNTCNTWAARALAAAGVPVRPGDAARAEDLMRQLRPLAAR
jgi:uncharacterized protein (TIGR02117 family)